MTHCSPGLHKLCSQVCQGQAAVQELHCCCMLLHPYVTLHLLIYKLMVAAHSLNICAGCHDRILGREQSLLLLVVS